MPLNAPQQIRLGTAHNGSIITVLLVEASAAFVQLIHLVKDQCPTLHTHEAADVAGQY